MRVLISIKNLTNINSFSRNCEPTDDFHNTTKTFVDSLSGRDMIGRDMSTVSKDQDFETGENKLTNLDSLGVNENRSQGNEFVFKKIVAEK